MKNILIASAILLGTAGSASAQSFVESYTSADLVGGGEDGVITTVNYGIQGDSLEGSIGAGYGSDGDQLVIRAEGRVYKYLGNDVTLEGELETLYGTGTDVIVVKPQLRVRKYW